MNTYTIKGNTSKTPQAYDRKRYFVILVARNFPRAAFCFQWATIELEFQQMHSQCYC